MVILIAGIALVATSRGEGTPSSPAGSFMDQDGRPRAEGSHRPLARSEDKWERATVDVDQGPATFLLTGHVHEALVGARVDALASHGQVLGHGAIESAGFAIRLPAPLVVVSLQLKDLPGQPVLRFWRDDARDHDNWELGLVAWEGHGAFAVCTLSVDPVILPYLVATRQRVVVGAKSGTPWIRPFHGSFDFGLAFISSDLPVVECRLELSALPVNEENVDVAWGVCDGEPNSPWPPCVTWFLQDSLRIDWGEAWQGREVGSSRCSINADMCVFGHLQWADGTPRSGELLLCDYTRPQHAGSGGEFCFVVPDTLESTLSTWGEPARPWLFEDAMKVRRGTECVFRSRLPSGVRLQLVSEAGKAVEEYGFRYYPSWDCSHDGEILDVREPIVHRAGGVVCCGRSQISAKDRFVFWDKGGRFLVFQPEMVLGQQSSPIQVDPRRCVRLRRVSYLVPLDAWKFVEFKETPLTSHEGFIPSQVIGTWSEDGRGAVMLVPGVHSWEVPLSQGGSLTGTVDCRGGLMDSFVVGNGR